jgi:hypothetical protein
MLSLRFSLKRETPPLYTPKEKKKLILERESLRRIDEKIMPASFSEVRYFLRCPKDFQFRKSYGVSPSIREMFGFGKTCDAVRNAQDIEPRKQKMWRRGVNPKVFSPRGEERVPLKLLQCLKSINFCKPCCRKHLEETEV